MNDNIFSDEYFMNEAIKEANKLKHSFPSAGGFARHYKGSDPRSRYNR